MITDLDVVNRNDVFPSECLFLSMILCKRILHSVHGWCKTCSWQASQIALWSGPHLKSRKSATAGAIQHQAPCGYTVLTGLAEDWNAGAGRDAGYSGNGYAFSFGGYLQLKARMRRTRLHFWVFLTPCPAGLTESTGGAIPPQ